MILIDTDHATLFKYPESERGSRFIARLEAIPREETVGVAIVSIEERMRGWLAAIAKEKTARRQVHGYGELANLFEFYQLFEIVVFDDLAANEFEGLRKLKLRVGTMDLKIAATAIVNQALLLSANLTDFKKVPALRVENWLD